MADPKRWMRYRHCLSSGDWHSHSTFTDGKSSVDEMCTAAVRNGLKLLALTEHVRRSLTYDFNAFAAAVERTRERFPQLQILAGCEAKVLNLQGDLDVSDEVLARCDVVMGVFHSFPHAHKEAYLEALCNMLQKEYVDLWGHPTLFAARHRIELSEADARLIGGVCNRSGVLVERNSRYQLPKPAFIRDAVITNWVCGSDAHRAADVLSLDDIRCAMS